MKILGGGTISKDSILTNLRAAFRCINKKLEEELKNIKKANNERA